MTLREALSQIPDPRARNRQYPLWGLLALILVAFLSRVDSLRGVERFARANPHLLPHLGLRKPPGHTILTLLLHRLDPEKLQEALLQVFPGADLGEVLVVDGKHLKGSGKGKSPQVRLVEVLALHLLIPFYAESLVLGHQWKRVCRLRVSGAFSRTRHRSATTSIISSRS
jgi:hypothetical protein